VLQRRTPQGLRQLIDAHSDTIRVARVLCIVPMAYVHVSLGEAHTPTGAVMRSVLRDLLGRSSVLLLSVVSGLLMVQVFASRPWLTAARSRTRGLVVPMVVWNLLALAVLAALGRPWTGELFNGLFALTDHGVTRPLTFLRDLFLVSLLTPALAWLVRRGGLWVLVPLVCAGGFVSTKPLIAHSQIVSYFTLGVGIGVLTLERLSIVGRLARAAPWALLGLAVLSAARPLGGDALSFMGTNAFDALVRRPVCVAGFWVLATRLVTLERLRTLVVRWLEPAIFAMFLSHAMVLQLLRMGVLGTGIRHPAFLLACWLALPPLALLVAVGLQRALLRGPGVLYTLLLGKPKPPR
jgi:hypothetical protein